MAWFGRKKKPQPEPTAARPEAPRSEGVDAKLVDEILTWLTNNTDKTAVRSSDPLHIHLGTPPQGAPAGAVLKVKRGKLAWVDLYDPALRAPVNDLVKYLDKQQKWSFNGVIATKYDEQPRTA